MPTSDRPNLEEPKRRRAPVHQIIRLSARDSRAVIEALLHRAPPGPALRTAAECYQRLVCGEDK